MSNVGQRECAIQNRIVSRMKMFKLLDLMHLRFNRTMENYTCSLQFCARLNIRSTPRGGLLPSSQHNMIDIGTENSQ